MTSCRMQLNYSSTVTLHGGPVVLRPVKATPCFNFHASLLRAHEVEQVCENAPEQIFSTENPINFIQKAAKILDRREREIDREIFPGLFRQGTSTTVKLPWHFGAVNSIILPVFYHGKSTALKLKQARPVD